MKNINLLINDSPKVKPQIYLVSYFETKVKNIQKHSRNHQTNSYQSPRIRNSKDRIFDPK